MMWGIDVALVSLSAGFPPSAEFAVPASPATFRDAGTCERTAMISNGSCKTILDKCGLGSDAEPLLNAAPQ